MNLHAYDNVNPVFTTHWIVPENKKLYSYVVPYYKYYTFLKRYNKNNNTTDYYIAFSNCEDIEHHWYKTYLTNSKALKIDLSSIWNNSIFQSITHRRAINLVKDAVFEDGVVYQIEL